MPRVPIQTAPRVQSATLPGARQSSSLSPALAGGIAADQQQQIGRAAMGLGSDIARIQIDEQNRANQVRVNDAMNKAVQAKLKLTYDPQAGYSSLRGESALNRPDGKSLDEEYGEQFDQHIASIADSLGNDAQKQAFREQAAQLGVQFRGGLQQHVAREYGEYQVGVQQGTVKTAQQQMGFAWEDPAALTQSVEAIKAATYEEGRLRGWSGQQIEAATVEQLSRGHTAALAAMVDGGKLDYAREYFKQHGASLTNEARLHAQKVLDAGDFEERTQNAAGSLYSEHKGDIAGALSAAREKYKGKDEDAIVQRLKGLDSERVALRERAQKDAADTAWRYVAKGKAPPPSLMAALDGRDAVAVRRSLAEGPARKTDMSKWLEFTNKTADQLAAMSPQDLLRDYSAHFTPSDVRSANDMMLAAKGLKGKGKANDDGLQLITTNDLMKRSAREMGILPASGDKLTPEQDAAYVGFTDRIQTKVNAWEAANKKKASPEVLRELLNEEKINKVRLDVWGRDPERAVASLKGDDLNKAYVVAGGKEVKLSSIPAEYRAGAVRRIQSRGLPVTEQLIAQMWLADRPTK